MSTEITTNLIMQPIQYNGQTYFSSQYFHSQYRGNNGDKYAQLKDFNRLIRGIETYQSYLDREDIVELTWQVAKQITGAGFAPVFESIGYRPLMLINATAQIALTHHLDDEISKTVSVAINAKTAEEVKPFDSVKLSRTSKAMLSMAKAFGLKGNQAILSADRATRMLEGQSPLTLLGVELISESKENLLTATDLGATLNLSAVKPNQLLETSGFLKSYRDLKDKKQWELTDKGKPYAELLDTGKKHSNGAPVTQIKWRSGVANLLQQA